MAQRHPVAPSTELVQEWLDGFYGRHRAPVDLIEKALAVQAAQWGADQELEACCKLLELSDENARDFLCSARRPEPLSLKQQALELIEECYGLEPTDVDTIRRALEQLP